MGGILSKKEKKKKNKVTEVRNQRQQQEKRYDPLDRTLRIVDTEDECDYECLDFGGPRALMSCGHAATPMSLSRWCQRQLEEGKSKFVCGNCDVEWPFEEVRKMALLTPEEVEHFEKKIFSNTADNFMDVRNCPGCNSLVARNEVTNLNVQCSVCTDAKKRTYRFCWQCLKEWKGPGPRSDRCDNAGCQDSALEILKTCPEITFNEVKGVRGCPCTRACPTCGLLLEHSKKQCKSMTCRRCEVKFCFVCLSFSEECLLNRPYEACRAGVAPRQTSIPKWSK